MKDTSLKAYVETVISGASAALQEIDLAIIKAHYENPNKKTQGLITDEVTEQFNAGKYVVKGRKDRNDHSKRISELVKAGEVIYGNTVRQGNARGRLQHELIPTYGDRRIAVPFLIQEYKEKLADLENQRVKVIKTLEELQKELTDLQETTYEKTNV